ncbi:MAG: DUF2892 domain-containing protein [Chitinispirillaceae bacterium]|nr:DUF2892 domain-containing protein [Chitinispirillaceae bacterium]
MKVNMGLIDRIVRITVAVILSLLIISGKVSGVTAIILGIIALVFLGTGIFSLCPIYYSLGISTCKRAPVGDTTETKADDAREESRS